MNARRVAAVDLRDVGAAKADACRSLGGTMLRIMRASVVLPLPDSPMMAKISGLSRFEPRS